MLYSYSYIYIGGIHTGSGLSGGAVMDHILGQPLYETHRFVSVEHEPRAMGSC